MSLERYRGSDFSHKLSVSRGDNPADVVINGRIVNVITQEIYPASVAIVGNQIVGVSELSSHRYCGKEEHNLNDEELLIPGFIDAHIHIESSCLTPVEFGKLALHNGTTGVVCDPHEIANVLGEDGIKFMIDNSKLSDLNFYWMYPSCVPATDLETSGAILDYEQILDSEVSEECIGLAEVMNFPGVVSGNPDLHGKIDNWDWGNTQVDGHCPGLSGPKLNAYIFSGIKSDHECTTGLEMVEKLRKGMHIFIREGSVTKNMLDLIPHIPNGAKDRVSFCSDDRLPAEMVDYGHLNYTFFKAVNECGLPIPLVSRMMSYNTSKHFGLKSKGAIAPGFDADLVVIKAIESKIVGVWKSGKNVKDIEKSRRDDPNSIDTSILNTVHVSNNIDLKIKIPSSFESCNVIGVVPNQAITEWIKENDPSKLTTKIAVIERHGKNGNVGLGFVSGLGIESGAIASTVAHDHHNIVVAGLDDHSMHLAVEALVDMRGGLVAIRNDEVVGRLRLPIGGLMSSSQGSKVAVDYKRLLEATKPIFGKFPFDGTTDNPFMVLSFLSLAVIPHLKITDMGLVDVNNAKMVPLWNHIV